MSEPNSNYCIGDPEQGDLVCTKKCRVTQEALQANKGDADLVFRKEVDGRNVLHCNGCGHPFGAHPSKQLHPPMAQFFRCHGTATNARNVAGLRKFIVTAGFTLAGYGSITHRGKDVEVDLYFDDVPKAHQFVTQVRNELERHVRLDVRHDLQCADAACQLPEGCVLLPQYEKDDDSFEEPAPTSEASSIGQLPADSPNICSSRFGQVVHLVPKCLLAKSTKNGDVPFALIGGPHDVNVMSDEQIPSVRFSIKDHSSTDQDPVTIKLVLTVQQSDFVFVHPQLVASTVQPNGDNTVSLLMNVQIPSLYLDSFKQVIEWREKSVAAAEEKKQSGTLGHTNKANKNKAWYELVPLPPCLSLHSKQAEDQQT